MSAYGGRGPEILGVSWTLAAVTTIIIGLRTYVRFGLKRRPGHGHSWDLWWAYLAWAFGILGMSCMSVAVHYGYGNHLAIVVARGNIEKASLFQWIWASFSSIMIVIAKFSVVAFLLNVQGPTHSWAKYTMFTLVGVSFMANFATVFLIWFQCTPPSKLWKPEIEGSCGAGEKVNFDVSTFSGSWGAATDVFLALYPVGLVASLEISKRLKILLGCLMGLGLFTAVCSIVKTYELHVVTESKDPTYDAAPLALWGIAESWVVLIASGIPAIWPLIKKALDETSFFGRLQHLTTIMLRSLLSSRESGTRRNGSDHSENMAFDRQQEPEQRHGLPSTHTQAFARLDSSERELSIPKNTVVVTKGYEVQEENAPHGTWNTYGLPEMQAQSSSNSSRQERS